MSMAFNTYPIGELPKELLLYVGSFLPPNRIACCCMVNRKWREIFSENSLWKKIFTQRSHEWGLSIRSKENSFKKLYQEYIFSDVIASFPVLSRKNLLRSPELYREVNYYGHKVKVVNFETDKPFKIVTGHLLCCDEFDVKIINLEDHKKVELIGKTKNRSHIKAVDMNENILVIARKPGSIEIWDYALKKCIQTWSTIQRIDRIKLFEDKIIVAAKGTSESSVKLLSFHGVCERNFLIFGKNDELTTLDMKIEGEDLISVFKNGTVRRGDIKTGLWVETFLLEKAMSLGSEEVKIGDKYIVGFKKDSYSICIWDRSNGTHLHDLDGHEGHVSAFQLSGNVCVSVALDGAVRQWRMDTGKCEEILQLVNSKEKIQALSFLLAEQRLILKVTYASSYLPSSFEKELWMWRFSSKQLIEQDLERKPKQKMLNPTILKIKGRAEDCLTS